MKRFSCFVASIVFAGSMSLAQANDLVIGGKNFTE